MNAASSPTPLSDAQARELLTPHEVFRDPIHGDITITALERAIIDSRAFQRLRSIKQLGPTDLVYPGAVHTRFQHSLGTVHCVEKLVHTVNRNSEIYSQAVLVAVEPYPHVLIRLVALVHDIAHMPFGHTLEDEGNLASPEWDDRMRVKHWLGPSQEIPQRICDYLTHTGLPLSVAERIVDDIREYVTFKGDPMELDYPFVLDLVGNTLCADLLDYIERDTYFCGLRERTGDRVVRHLAIVGLKSAGDRDDKQEAAEEPLTLFPMSGPADEGKGKGRVVLLAYRFEKEHDGAGDPKLVSKPEILSEAIDLLRCRFSLAEKVYFHRTKVSASAMLISAVQSASLDLSSMYEDSDETFIGKLQSNSNPRARHIAQAYASRSLFKAAYRLNYREERDTDSESLRLWRDRYPLFRDPNWRRQREEELENYAGLPQGSVAIYCPAREMNLKRFEMLVQTQPGAEIKQLGQILDATRKQEMEAINRRFQELWSLQVFVDPKCLDASRVADERVEDFNKLCEETIGFPNDIASLQGRGRPLREQLAARVVRDFEESHGVQVPFDTYDGLASAPYRDDADLLESMRKQLEGDMGASGSKGETK